MVNIKLHKTIILLCLVLLLACTACSASSNNYDRSFTAISKISSRDWNDPEELERVWQAALVRIPQVGSNYIAGSYISGTIGTLTAEDFENMQKFPTIIYMHGCSGIWQGTYRRINFLAEHGYAVIAPPSFAREKYAKSCNPEQHRGGLYRDVLKMRQFDAGHSIEKAKNLSWVDVNNVFLMGLSEGGITTATFKSKNNLASVNARVVEGWTCNSTWNEYKGINAPKNEPVLTLLGSKDPWFQNPYTNGECTNFINKKNGSKSVVYKKGNLSYQHELLEDQEVKKEVLEFLQQHIK